MDYIWFENFWWTSGFFFPEKWFQKEFGDARQNIYFWGDFIKINQVGTCFYLFYFNSKYRPVDIMFFC